MVEMLLSDRSFTVSPCWLQGEADRLAQTASPEQQKQTVKLMTPLMSDIERNVSCAQQLSHLSF